MKPVKPLVLLTVVLSSLGLAGAAWASWAALGSGSVSASTATLAPPTSVTVPAASTGAVGVSWTASSTAPPDVAPEGYYVQRLGGTPSPAAACGTAPGSLTAATSCLDWGFADGTFTYRVTAVLGSWSAQSAPSGPVTVNSDTTAPTLVSGGLEMLDTDINGRVDRVTATFSETLAPSAATAPWTLANVPSGGSLSSVSTSGTVATLTLNEGAGSPSTAVGSFTVALAANPAGIRDAAGNQSSFAATAPIDKAAPARTGLQMLDSNTNGKVDRVTAAFSETVAAYTAGTAPWTLASVPSGGSLGSVTTSASQATLVINEGTGAADTSVGSFTVALSTSATGIRDAAGNQATFAATAPGDGAAPRLLSVTSGGGATPGLMESGDTLTLTFSEALDPTSVPATAAVTESRSPGSTTLTIPGVTNSAGIANSYLGGNNSTGTSTGTISRPDSKTITITLGAISTTGSGVAAGTGSVTLSPAPTIEDPAANAAAAQAATLSRLF